MFRKFFQILTIKAKALDLVLFSKKYLNLQESTDLESFNLEKK